MSHVPQVDFTPGEYGKAYSADLIIDTDEMQVCECVLRCVQCVAVCCSVLQCIAYIAELIIDTDEMQVCECVLKCVASVCYSVFQCVASTPSFYQCR